MADTVIDRVSDEIATTGYIDRQVTLPSIKPPAGTLESALSTIRAMKSILDAREGVSGSVLDKALTLRDLIDSKLLQIETGGQTIGGTGGLGATFSGSGLPGPKGDTGAVGPSGGGFTGFVDPRPIVTTPPTPGSFTAVGMFSSTYLEWSLLDYQNHSHIEVWRAAVVDGLPAPGLGAAVKVGESTSTIFVDKGVARGFTYYYWVRAAALLESGVLVFGAYNSATGTPASLAANPALLQAMLAGKITESELFATLGARINLIDGADSVAGTVAARVKAERLRAESREGEIQDALIIVSDDLYDPATGLAKTAEVLDVVRTTVNDAAHGNLALAQRASVLEVTSQPFSPSISWEFNGTTDGWTGFSNNSLSHGSTSAGGTYLVGTSSANLAPPSGEVAAVILERHGLNIVGAQTTKVRARIKRAAGAGTWSGTVYYETSGHPRSGAFIKTIPEPAWGPDGWAVAEWDMAALTAGGADWTSSTITSLWIDLTRGDAGGVTTWHVDWIAPGDRGVGISAATVADETQARVNDVGSLGQRITTVAASSGGAGAINPDPLFQAFGEQWMMIAGAAPTIVQGSVPGRNAVQGAVGGTQFLTRQSFTTPPDRTFSVGVTWRRVGATGAASYLVVALYDQNGGLVTESSGGNTYWWYPLSFVNPTTDWVRHVFKFGAGTTKTLPPQAVSMRIGLLLNYQDIGGIAQAEDLRLEYADADRVQGNLDAQVLRIDAAETNISGKASASSVTTLQAKVDTPSAATPSAAYNPTYAALQSFQAVQATTNGQLTGQAFLKLDLNGYVTGWGLSSTVSTAGPSSSFVVRADTFSLASPAGAATPTVAPFIQKTVADADGPIGTYMSSAFITNMTALHARIQNLIVDQIRATTISASQLTLGDGVVGGSLKSVNYAAGNAGWLLQRTGEVFFLQAVIGTSTTTATIFAGAGQIGGFTIGAHDIRSSNFAPNTSGLRFSDNGVCEIYNLFARGHIEASTGTLGDMTVTGTLTGGTINGSVINGSAINGSTVTGSTIIAGVARNASSSNYIDFGAAGTDTALSFGNGRARITADGKPFFLESLGDGTWSASPGAFLIKHGGLSPPVSSLTFYLDTGVNIPWAEKPERSLTARFGNITTHIGVGSVPPGNYIFTPRISLTVCVAQPQFNASGAAIQSTNPYSASNQRIFLRVEADVATSLGGVDQVSLTSLRWFLDYSG